MMKRLAMLLALLLPFALAGCFLAPGKFTSTLDIRADRSFTFTYVGEVVVMNSKDMMKDAPGGPDSLDQSMDDQGAVETDAVMMKIAAKSAPRKPAKKGKDFGDEASDAARLRALAATLSQEYGYRSVRYIGDHKLAIDYAISGRLDRGFIYPFNVDAEVLVPFLAIELRGRDRLRIKAPGFANEKTQAGGMGGPTGLPGGADLGDALDGTFTLTTDAEIISQNQEEGPSTRPDGRRQIIWRATPTSRDAPMAVLKVAPLP